VTRAAVAVEGEAEQAHGGVGHRVDDGGVEERPVLRVGEDALVVGVPVAAVRGVREEVACARGDVDPIVVDRDAERVAGRRDRGEHRHGVAGRA
jgi:hypothetical protein